MTDLAARAREWVDEHLDDLYCSGTRDDWPEKFGKFVAFLESVAAEARAEERARIVAWLRKRVAVVEGEMGYRTGAVEATSRAADAVERGDHATPASDRFLAPTCADCERGDVVVKCECGKMRPADKPCGYRKET